MVHTSAVPARILVRASRVVDTLEIICKKDGFSLKSLTSVISGNFEHVGSRKRRKT